MNVFKSWCQSRHLENVNIMETMVPEELDNILSKLYAEVEKRDGDYYQRESLKVMQSNIEKYLKEKNYPPSIVRSREFHKKSSTRRQFLWTRRNYHHWFLSMASNSKVKCTRPWDLILIFRQLVLQDFHQVVPYSSSTAWKLRRRIIPAVLTIFSPKRTRCLSHNRRRSEGLILLSQTTRISLWKRLFLQ